MILENTLDFIWTMLHLGDFKNKMHTHIHTHSCTLTMSNSPFQQKVFLPHCKRCWWLVKLKAPGAGRLSWGRGCARIRTKREHPRWIIVGEVEIRCAAAKLENWTYNRWSRKTSFIKVKSDSFSRNDSDPLHTNHRTGSSSLMITWRKLKLSIFSNDTRGTLDTLEQVTELYTWPKIKGQSGLLVKDSGLNKHTLPHLFQKLSER